MYQMTIFDIEVYCEHELKMVDMGKTYKSLCARMGCWTNCRDWGSCVADMRLSVKTERGEKEE